MAARLALNLENNPVPAEKLAQLGASLKQAPKFVFVKGFWVVPLFKEASLGIKGHGRAASRPFWVVLRVSTQGPYDFVGFWADVWAAERSGCGHPIGMYISNHVIPYRIISFHTISMTIQVPNTLCHIMCHVSYTIQHIHTHIGICRCIQHLTTTHFWVRQVARRGLMLLGSTQSVGFH